MAKLTGDWADALKDEFQKPYYKNLYAKILQEYREHVVYPPSSEIFNALHLTPLNSVKAVILGQDPYHEPGQAHGLCFSVQRGVQIPPSLVNIYKEMESDLGIKTPAHGDLTCLAKQGVLLLNTALTVRAHQANSHRGYGWEAFTDAIIKAVDKSPNPIVFLLWGSNAAAKEKLLSSDKHLVLKAPHPSPLSAYRGFFGCKHFSKTNEFLVSRGIEPINWEIK